MVIGIIVAGTWLSLMICAVALCRVAGQSEHDVIVPARGEEAFARPGEEVFARPVERARTPARRRAPASTGRRAGPSRETSSGVLLTPH